MKKVILMAMFTFFISSIFAADDKSPRKVGETGKTPCVSGNDLSRNSKADKTNSPATKPQKSQEKGRTTITD